MFGKNRIAALVAEFLGTYVLASVVLSMAGRTAFPFFVAAAAGATVGLMVLVIGNSSGAHINPAVTIGLWTIRRVDTVRALTYLAAQALGGLVAWKLNEYLLNSPLKSIAGDRFDWRVFVAEAVGTFVFTFGVAAAVYLAYRGLRLAVTIGASFGAGVLVATFASNGLLNPAVALGVKSWSLAYVGAPILGAIVGMNLYALLFSTVLATPSKVTVRGASTSTTTNTAKKRTTTRKTSRKR